MKPKDQAPLANKVQTIIELKEKLKSSVATVVTDFKGMKVSEISELRNRLREKQIEYKVVKNSLFIKALKDAGIEGLDEHITGPLAVAFSSGDPVSPAKVIMDYFDETEKPKVKVGIIENKLADEKLIADLAKLPSREELIAKVVGGIKSPLQGLVMVLSGLPRKLVYVIDAIKNKKEKGGE